jgi:hypothetical protein
VLKRSGKAPPTPLGQVSAQSDKFCYAFVHPECQSVKTTILITKCDIAEMSFFVIFELMG